MKHKEACPRTLGWPRTYTCICEPERHARVVARAEAAVVRAAIRWANRREYALAHLGMAVDRLRLARQRAKPKKVRP